MSAGTNPQTWVILLRGVMPSGKNAVPMAPLRAALADAGLGKVRTYIQSGNVIATSALPQAGVEQLVHDVIKQNFGGELAIVARTPEQIRGVLERSPFRGADTSRLYFTLLASPPDPALVADLAGADWSPDELRVVEDCIYTLFATRLSDSKLNNNFYERKLKVAATTRNFNTMTKLVELTAGAS